MPTFAIMASWTDKGISAVKDVPKRTQAARELAKKLGVEIKQIFLTSRWLSSPLCGAERPSCEIAP